MVLLGRNDTEPLDLSVLIGPGELVNRAVGESVPQRNPRRGGIGSRRWLRTRLPEVLIPAMMEVVDRLPMTDRGKVDVRALTGRAAQLADEAGELTGAPYQEHLAAIWRDVLGLGTIGARSVLSGRDRADLDRIVGTLVASLDG